MTSVRLPETLEMRLEHLAMATKRSKSFYIKEAVTQYLDDMEDAYTALERITQPKRKFYASAEVLKKIRAKKP